uniref:DAGKc domain-containing protein n=1 Tax=Chlamydomonas leiostraca TaxID=1034604 RepID=A0A7S0RH37_9CHLO|mmetsp:Transcript_22621/g.57549  ORF Transcript_22621/g.57549 Transcript_22621/m.57549 type:complete len:748 (+) Transcript_22621:136-2379(+)
MSALLAEVSKDIPQMTQEGESAERSSSGTTATSEREPRIGKSKSLTREGLAEPQPVPMMGAPEDQSAVVTAEHGAEPGPSASGRKGNRLLVLLHGEKAGDELVRDAVKRLRSEGHEITVRVTYEAGDVDRLVAEAVALGDSADVLVAAGGDGTVNEVTAALLRHTGGLQDSFNAEVGGVGAGEGRTVNPSATSADASSSGQQHKQERKAGTHPLHKFSIGILPMGTSNDFAATTAIPQDPYEALKLMTDPGTARPIDVGLLNGQVFMNTATIGASADVGKITSSGLKRLLGPAAFLFTGVRAATRWAPVDSVLHFPELSLKEGQVSVLQGDVSDTAQASATGGQGGGNGGGEAGSALVRSLSQDMHASEAVQAVPVCPHGSRVSKVEGESGNGNNGGKKGKKARAKAAAGGSKGEREEGAVPEPASALGSTRASVDLGTAASCAATCSGQRVGSVSGVPLLHLTAANNRQIASMVAVAPNALLDDGLLDCVYLTGTPGQQARRLLRDIVRKGLGKTRATSSLLRVPWLEVQASGPLEWSLDGEPAPEPATHFRFSLLHAAVRVHLPDDRMLVAGHSGALSRAGSQEAPRTISGRGHGGGPMRGARRQLARLRPGPTLGELMGAVVRFRKKKDWGKALRGFTASLLKTALIAAAGGAVVHAWHKRNDTRDVTTDAATSTSKAKNRSVRATIKQAQKEKKQGGGAGSDNGRKGGRRRRFLGWFGRNWEEDEEVEVVPFTPPTTRPLPVS